MKNKKSLWVLFRSMFVLSLCAFGGGFVVLSLMRKKFVEELKWMEEDEMMDVTAITQTAPGPIMVNAAVIIGYRARGYIGSLISVLGAVIPPMVILSVISIFYDQFRANKYIAIALQVMRAGVAAVIMDVVISLAKNVISTKRKLYIIMMVLAFVAVCFFKVGAMTVIFICIGVGLIDLLCETLKKRKEDK